MILCWTVIYSQKREYFKYANKKKSFSYFDKNPKLSLLLFQQEEDCLGKIIALMDNNVQERFVL